MVDSRAEFEMNEALRVATSSTVGRAQAALYLCRVVRRGILVGDTWTGTPIGFDWLIRNQAAFRRCVSDAGPLFRSFMEEPEYILKIVHDEHLLQLVAPGSIEAFVRDVLRKHQIWNWVWLACVRSAGIPTEKQAAIMIDTITAALERRDILSHRYVANFLQARHVDYFYKWDILSQDQLYDTLKRCVEMCPGEAVQTAEHLVPYVEARLTPEQRDSFFSMIPGCGRWDYTKVESVAALPYTVQCRLVAQALEVSSQILEHVVTIPDGRETVIEYLKRQHASIKYKEQVGAADPQCVAPGADALLSVLKAAPSRHISDVPVKFTVL
jgi:hypothetical protein